MGDSHCAYTKAYKGMEEKSANTDERKDEAEGVYSAQVRSMPWKLLSMFCYSYPLDVALMELRWSMISYKSPHIFPHAPAS